MSKLGLAAASAGALGTGGAGIYGAHALGAFGSTETKGTRNNGVYTTTIQDEKTHGEKKNSDKTDNKRWEGSVFRLVGTLAKEEAGAVISLTATVKDANTMTFEGTAYVMEKKGDQWQPTKKLGMKDTGKTLESKEGKTKFPKIGSSDYFSRKGIEEYWGFLDKVGVKLKELGGQGAEHHFWWKWVKQSPTYSPKNGSENFDTWWDYFFGKNKWDMKVWTGNVYGTWSNN